MAGVADEPLAASAGWSSDDTLIVKACAYETPFHRTLKVPFAGDQSAYDFEVNVGFGGTKRP